MMTAPSRNGTSGVQPAIRDELAGWAHELRLEGLGTEEVFNQIRLDYQAKASRYAAAYGSDLIEPTDEDFKAIAEDSRLTRFLTDAEIEKLPPPEYQVGELWPVGGLVVPFGPPGAGKTFFTVAASLSLATGMRFQGQEVKRAPAVYIAAEGSGGMGSRVRAWKEHRGWAGSAGVHFLTQPVNLLNSEDVGRFMTELAMLDEAPGAVVFDTLARCMIGGDENSALDMGRAIDAADQIRHTTGATVILVHHTNKGGDLERGSTALRGAADTMLSIKDEDGTMFVRCEKQKDAEPFRPLRLRRQKVAESCVLQPATDAWQVATDELTTAEREALETLSRDFLEDGATLTAWKTSGNIADRTIYRVRTSLVTKGYVEQVGEGRGARHVLTDKGRSAVPAKPANPATTLPAGSSQPASQTGGSIEDPPLAGWEEELEV